MMNNLFYILNDIIGLYFKWLKYKYIYNKKLLINDNMYCVIIVLLMNCLYKDLYFNYR